jgi:hypothetical protein
VRPVKVQEEQAHFVGTSAEWKRYRQELDALLEESVHKEVVREHGDFHRYFKNLDKIGTPHVDVDGALWLEIPGKGETYNVGLSASNILEQSSDTQLAYSLLLWRAHGVLKSPKHSRETMTEFEKDWELLQRARLKNAVLLARDRGQDKGSFAVDASIVGKD